ncbi:PE-PPE domain-containing protein [Mycobacterium sp. BMJ-28]
MAFFSSVGVGVRLLAGTLVAIGGNSNPTSAGMIQELGGDPFPPGTPNTTGFPVGVAGHGYLDPANPNSPYYGYNFQPVSWPSQIPFTGTWDGASGFEDSQRQGLANVQALMGPALQSGEPVTVAGYSSGANVVVREMRYLQSIGAPATEQLSFVLFAGMNRPNGGIANRFPGLFVPFFNVKFDGTTPTDTPYKTLDVSWEYDPISDFPNYPLNLVADLNSLVAFFTQHSNYYPADLDGPRAVPDRQGPNSNITYVTLAARELPLLVPLKMLGAPKQLLDLVRPVLKVLVDLGYDRSINPGVATPASLSPTPGRLLALPGQLLSAVGVGIQHALNPSWDKPGTGTGAQSAVTAATATALPQAAKASQLLTAKTGTGKDDTASSDPDTSAGTVDRTAAQTATAPAPGKAVEPDSDGVTAGAQAADTDGADVAPAIRKRGTPRHRADQTATTPTDSTDVDAPSGTPRRGTGKHRGADSGAAPGVSPAAGGKHAATDTSGADTSGTPGHAGRDSEGARPDKLAA